MKDYYKTLGVEKNATEAEIKKAFRKLALEHHPDKTGGKDDKFKEINEAYSTLGDTKKRQQYDAFGSAGPGMGGAGFGGGQGFGGFDFSGFQQGQSGGVEFDLGDIFGSFFGGGRGGRSHAVRGADIQVDIEISFAESALGVDKLVEYVRHASCATCNGTRSEPGSETRKCDTCKGSGHVVRMQRSIFGNVEQQLVCEVCDGLGKIPTKKCHTCHGVGLIRQKEQVTIHVPGGIGMGDTLRVGGRGEVVTGAGNVPGDLFVRVRVRQDARFRKEGHTVFMTQDVPLSVALAGGDIKVMSFDQEFTIGIPQGVTTGDVLRAKEKGCAIDSARKSGKRGDMHVTIRVNMPKKMTGDVKSAVELLKKAGF